MDIYTTGGANADITATVKTLPGAQQVGEQEGLFVRGVQIMKPNSLLTEPWLTIPITLVFPTWHNVQICSQPL